MQEQIKAMAPPKPPVTAPKIQQPIAKPIPALPMKEERP
jgi:hypothetical protein